MSSRGVGTIDPGAEHATFIVVGDGADVAPASGALEAAARRLGKVALACSACVPWGCGAGRTPPPQPNWGPSPTTSAAERQAPPSGTGAASGAASATASGAASAASATATLAGSCSFLEGGSADNEAEAFTRHVHVVIAGGRITEVRDTLTSGATGVLTAVLAGAGPAVELGQWLTVNVAPEPPTPGVPRSLELRLAEQELTIEGVGTGRCEWSTERAPARAEPGPPARGAAPVVESPGPERAIVRVGELMLDCTAIRSAHAALTECRMRGTNAEVTVAWGMSDSNETLMCSWTPVTYSWQHGGGWDSEHGMTPVAASGARVRLADGVEVWLDRALRRIDVVGEGGSVRLDVDLESSTISAQVGAGQAHPAAALIADLSRAKPPSERCSAH